MKRSSSSSQVSERRRIAAPRQLVWKQVGLNDAFFDTLPVAETAFGEDGRSASFEARLGFGPVRFKRRGSATVTDERPLERMAFEGTLEDGSLAVVGRFELTDPGDDESLLTYEAELELRHEMPRLRRLLEGVLEDHVRDVVEHAAHAAERHWKAECTMADLKREG